MLPEAAAKFAKFSAQRRKNVRGAGRLASESPDRSKLPDGSKLATHVLDATEKLSASDVDQRMSMMQQTFRDHILEDLPTVPPPPPPPSSSKFLPQRGATKSQEHESSAGPEQKGAIQTQDHESNPEANGTDHELAGGEDDSTGTQRAAAEGSPDLESRSLFERRTVSFQDCPGPIHSQEQME